ncbi:MAG TPA: TonB-dependent receptor [Bacteroidales bacterium]|nr:TonB-dependent receptor [Bacteroidales bacterium]
MGKVFITALLITVSLTGAASFQELPAIRGKVTDSEGNALAGASVTIENTYLGTFTDISGNYSFSGIRKGVYRLTFSFIGYDPLVKEINVEGSTVADVALVTRPYITDEVTINATRAGEKAPMAYSTVSSEQLKEQNTAYDMPYLLSLTPSFVETSEAGNGVGYTGLRIRGTDGNRINVTLDGIPLNDAESQQVFWVDLPDIASSVDNIQVQRGAGTSTNGAGAFGATISLQTTTADSEPFAEVSSSAGSFNTFKNSVSAGTGLLKNRFALQMRYSDVRSDGYVKRTGSDHRSAFISGLYRNDKSMLKANIILGEEHTGIGWWGVPKDSLATDRRYNPSGEYTDGNGVKRYYENESDNYSQDHYQLIYSRKLTEDLILNTAFHYTKGKGYYEEYREDQSYMDYGLASVQAGDSLLAETDMIRRKWLSNDFYGATYSLRYRKERMEAILGGGINTYLGDHFGRIIWMGTSGQTPKDYQWYFNDSRKGELSFYGKVNYSLSNKTNIFGDLQYRSVNYRLNGADDDLKDIGQKHTFRFFNPKAGIFHSITSNQDAWFSFSVANREPTRSDFKEASGDPAATPLPETLYDTELGYKLRNEKSSFSVNLYSMVYRDQLVPTGELSDVGYSIMTNVDKSYRLGTELVAAFRPAVFMGWNINMTLSRNKILNYIEYYTDYNTGDWSSEYKSKSLGTVDIAYSPSTIITSEFIFTLFKDLDLHLISKYVGKQYFDNTMNEERMINPYFVSNIRLDFSPEIKHTDNVEIQLLVNNLLNAKYENNAYGGNWYEDGTEKTWAYYFPQAGTNFMTRILVRF